MSNPAVNPARGESRLRRETTSLNRTPAAISAPLPTERHPLPIDRHLKLKTATQQALIRREGVTMTREGVKSGHGSMSNFRTRRKRPPILVAMLLLRAERHLLRFVTSRNVPATFQ